MPGARLAWKGVATVAPVLADDRGGFELASPGPGRAILLVEAAGFLRREIPVPDRASFLPVRLRHQLSWTGRVVTANHRGPIAGATVVLLLIDGTEVERAVTGKDGTFRIDGLSSHPYRVRVEAPGFFPVDMDSFVPGQARPVDIPLDRAIELRGVVVDARHHPVSQAEVNAWLTGPGGADSKHHLVAGTGVDGRFVLGSFPEGAVVLAEAHGGGLFGVAVADTVESAGLQIDAVPYAHLQVCGVWEGTDDPVVPFQLRVGSRQRAIRDLEQLEMLSLTATGATDTPCVTLDLPAGWYRPTVGGDEAVDRVLADVELVAGKILDLGNVALAHAPALNVSVEEETGVPIEAAQVTAYERRGGRNKVGDGETSADGRATLRRIPEGTYDVEVRADGFIPVLRERVTVPGPLLPLHLVRGGRLRGEVLEADGGLPITLFQVQIAPLDIDAMHPDLRLLRIHGTPPATHSDSQGRFTIDGLLDGHYTLTVSARGYIERSRSVEIGTGEEPEVTVLMEPGICAGGVVLTRASEAPLADAAIHPVPVGFSLTANSQTTLTYTDETGHFSLCDLADEQTQVVVVEHSGFAPQQVKVHGESSVTVLLAEGIRLEGRVRGQGDVVMQSWQVELSGPGWKRHGETDSSGSFAMDDLPAGDAHLVLTDPLVEEFDERVERRVHLEPGDVNHIEIALGSVLSGRILEGGVPLGGVLVRSVRLEQQGSAPENMTLHTTRSHDDGSFDLRHLSPGTYILQALLDAEIANRIVGVDESGARYDLDVGSVRVEGVTIDGDYGALLPGVEVTTSVQEPLSSFMIQNLSRGGNYSEVQGWTADLNASRSDGEGRFRLHLKEPSRGVSLYHPDYLPDEVGVERLLTGRTAALPLYRGSEVQVQLVAPNSTSGCQGYVLLLQSEEQYGSDTDALGHVRFDAVKAGEYDIWGTCGSSAPTRKPAVRVEPGQPTEMEIPLDRGSVVELWLPAGTDDVEARLRLRDARFDLTHSILLPLLSRGDVDKMPASVLRVRFEHFPAGDFILSDIESGSFPIETQVGEQVTVDLTQPRH
ncbi:MAG: carboxypeptidase regulatory-like domain-containing protein [Acidobacteriota bacterium]